MKKLLCLSMYGLVLSSMLNAMQKPTVVPAGAELLPALPSIEGPRQALLIFLDDGERHLEAITASFLSAFIEGVGPIIVSASVVANVREAKMSDEKDPSTLHQLAVKAWGKAYNEQKPEEKQELKDIVVSTISFDAKLAKNWVMKEINSSLYLLLPRNYLKAKNIPIDEIKKFSPQGSLTQTEQKLGLKVNHMKVATPADATRPLPEPKFADYFSDSLASIFVTNGEYVHEKNKVIPQWSIYIDGHGMIQNRICSLSIEQFKSFLDFLEKIKVRLLVYSSCYAAGTNAELMYKDAEKGITKTYSFAIVTFALTDAYTFQHALFTKFEHKKLSVDSNAKFKSFVQAITAPDVINYAAAIEAFSLPKEVGTTPQIKLPGIEWFSVLDRDKVAPIGSIMAKTRTEPLNIATFFASRKGEKAHPRGILLYAENIPFELNVADLVDAETKKMPTVVSMIPGGAVHFIKKIRGGDAREILNAFYIKGLASHKTFVIDEIEADLAGLIENQNSRGTLIDVIIEVGGSPETMYKIYFKYSENTYFSNGLIDVQHPIQKASDRFLRDYDELLKYFRIQKTPFLGISSQAKKIFPESLSFYDAIYEISGVIESMRNNTALHISKIGVSLPGMFEEDSRSFIGKLMKKVAYPSKDLTHKIVWIDSIDSDSWNPSGSRRSVNRGGGLKNIIIDYSHKGTRVFFTDKNKGMFVIVSETRAINKVNEDYVPVYKKMFEYFDTNMKLDDSLEETVGGIVKSSVPELLTPEAVAKIRAVQEKKVAHPPAETGAITPQKLEKKN